jgi:hypothetical protein
MLREVSVSKTCEPAEELGSGGADAKIEHYPSLGKAISTLETADGETHSTPIGYVNESFNRLGNFWYYTLLPSPAAMCDLHSNRQ